MQKTLENELIHTLGFAPILDHDKMSYTRKYPDHIVIYNCNIFAKDIGKVWYGDLDITANSVHLFILAKEFNTELYCLKEMDGRFDKENRTDFDKVAVWSTKM